MEELQKMLDGVKCLKIDYDYDIGIDFEKAQSEINQALQLKQTDVSMRSEQLKAFNKWFQENAPLYDYGIDETVIEDYLKSL